MPQLWFNGDDGNTYACGYNGQGQLGIGNTTGDHHRADAGRAPGRRDGAHDLDRRGL